MKRQTRFDKNCQELAFPVQCLCLIDNLPIDLTNTISTPPNFKRILTKFKLEIQLQMHNLRFMLRSQLLNNSLLLHQNLKKNPGRIATQQIQFDFQLTFQNSYAPCTITFIITDFVGLCMNYKLFVCSFDTILCIVHYAIALAKLKACLFLFLSFH